MNDAGGGSPFVAALVRSQQLIPSVLQGAGSARVVHARTVAHLADLMVKDSCAVVVYEAGAAGFGAHDVIAPLIGSALSPVVLALPGEWKPGAVADVFAMFGQDRDHCVVVATRDELRRAVASSLGLRAEPCAVPFMLARFLPLLPASIHGHVAHAAAIAKFDSSVELLARVGRVAASTMGHCLTWWSENGGFDALFAECVHRCTSPENAFS